MQNTRNPYLYLTLLVLLLFVIACNNNAAHTQKSQVVEDPDEMDREAAASIREALAAAVNDNGKIDDTIKLHLVSIVNSFYSSNNFSPVWSSKEKWQPLADSLFSFISHAEMEGLFPKDYHYKNLRSLKATLDEIQ
ncbi:MAG: hypothetical protein U0V75_06400 [Ferruginibacter sp.]